MDNQSITRLRPAEERPDVNRPIVIHFVTTDGMNHARDGIFNGKKYLIRETFKANYIPLPDGSVIYGWHV